MTRGAVIRRMALWIVFVAYSAYFMALGAPPEPQLAVGPYQVTLYQLLVGAALAFSLGEMGRAVVDHEPSITRTITRLVALYMLFDALVVLPVGIGRGMSFGAVAGAMAVRLTWLLLPTVVALCRDDRMSRAVGAVPLIATAGLAVWGLYFAATGGAGWYYEGGDIRYRVLWGGCTLLFAWPLVVAASGAVSRRLAAAFVVVALIGLTLTNHRSGLVACAVAVIFCVVASGAWRRIVVAFVPVTLAVIIIGLVAEAQIRRLFGYTAGALLDFSSGTGADRMVRWRLAWEMFRSHPFNDYVWSWTYYLVHREDPSAPHNFFLEIATTEGLTGLVFYGSVLWTTFRAGWSWVRRDAIVRALVGYVIAYLTFSLANTTLYSHATAPFFVAAVAAIAARVEKLRAAEIEHVQDAG